MNSFDPSVKGPGASHYNCEVQPNNSSNGIFNSLPWEIIKKIFSEDSIGQLRALKPVCKEWNLFAANTQIKLINEGNPLDMILMKTDAQMIGEIDAKKVMDVLIANPAFKLLENADFRWTKGFDNECLQKLTAHCPSLKHLLITSCEIKADALKFLEKTPYLQTLDFGGCRQLEASALKYLKFTPNLQDLSISGHLEADCLKHLANTPKLQSLSIVGATQLEADALKHLVNTPDLRRLLMQHCTMLEADALKHLEKTPHLHILAITSCNQLELDALKHFVNIPDLTQLYMECCTQLEADALKHLEHTPHLEYINASGCDQLNFQMMPKNLSFLIKQYL